MAKDRQMTAEMQATLQAQRKAFTATLPEPMAVRGDRLDRAIALLVDNAEDLAKAVSADFGHRSREQTYLADIMAPLSALRHARKHFESWARNERRKPPFPLGLLGAKAKIMYQPKGVVGIMSPWNFPIGLIMTPLAGILAAGNRAMIKPSEYTETVSELFAEIVPKYFAKDEIAVFTGGQDTGIAFSKLTLDHLLFTGATNIGRHVMQAAAANLVPVTLELGGKSPVIIGRSANLKLAGDRIALGKMLNAGQICLAPDYLLVPEDREKDVIDAVRTGLNNQYRTLLANDDYTSIVNQRNHERLQHYLADAREKGAELIEVNPGNEDFSSSNVPKMPLTILRHVTDDMKVMQEEIFGPILPIMTYDRIDGAINYVNDRDRPLGLYYFGTDEAEETAVLAQTISGGATVNDVLFHGALDDLPFGGIGASGMGNYHGFDGFRTFSHARSVYRQTAIDVAGLGGLKPPYGTATKKAIARELRKK
jgi:coniferyl-aldehyde dehydrogenase